MSTSYCMIMLCVIVNVSCKTALEKTCATFPYSFFHGHSCFIGSSDVKEFIPAKAVCEKPKPNLPIGHLAYILTQETLNALTDNVAGGKLLDHDTYDFYWIALEQIPDDDEGPGGTKGWTWTHPNLPDRPVPHHDIILWDYNPPQPHNVYTTDDVAAIHVSGGGAADINAEADIFYLCEYEEPTFRMYHRCYKNKIGHNTTIIAQHNSLSRAECAQKCGRDLMCRSFSFNQMTGHCYTQWTDGGVVNFGPIQQNGYDFFVSDYSYNKTIGSFCSVIMP